MSATTTRRLSTPQSRRAEGAVRAWRREGAAGTVGVIDPGHALDDGLTRELAGVDLVVLRCADPIAALVRFAVRPVQVAVLLADDDQPGVGPVVQALRAELALPVLLAWDPAGGLPPADAVLAGALPVLRLPLELDDVLARLGEVWPARPPGGSVLSAGDLVVDPGAYEATWSGIPLGLARREMNLLLALVQSPGRVVPREQLWRLWPSTSDQDGNLVAAVARLRRHFARAGAPAAIGTVRGLGYRLEVTALSSSGAASRSA
ncbi:winged helix-turn-helix domain-containing protein [Cellulomonas sp. ES6]|uniref:winged helix-turn-helix transcriptional regulator n=1 Tax=Cellulomonas sp. ES6 TaxID=3039384 RepID=UPI0024B64A28|nr:winged helix-turn-helix domain-containing protein [Cellulomonas sp. ES6]WHP16544.1 winged helix-turn-helix domain-containing protein [Cellulomonas sp. ES6]